MSWRSAVLTVLASASLAGCGFHPLYADSDTNGALEPRLAAIRVVQMHEREGQEMTNMLRDNFNPHALSIPASYQLEVNLTKQAYNTMQRADTTSARSDTRLTARCVLRRLSDKKEVLSWTSTALNSHDVLITDYANVTSAQQDLNLDVRSVGEDIENRIVAWLQSTKT